MCVCRATSFCEVGNLQSENFYYCNIYYIIFSLYLFESPLTQGNIKINISCAFKESRDPLKSILNE